MKVTSIPQSGDIAMNVSVMADLAYSYIHVISTIPLPGLQVIDLRDAGLNVMQNHALRKLHTILYEADYPDIPIRTIVYTSHGVESSTADHELLLDK
ncbi:hypothetical protein EDB19DRAFT_1788846 [Suillus lakei]|nr:hypothetical protein EDB19DRAFT_1788846 [Suillus lakei]